MKALVVVTVCVWAILSSCDVGDGAPDLTLTIGTKSTYTQFLISLRNNVKGREVYHEIPMMPAPTDPPNFLTVVLKPSDSDNSITISLDKNDLYMVGYSDTLSGKCRYHIFKDKVSVCPKSGKSLNCRLCEGITNAVSEPIKYESNYRALESNAKVADRSKIGLGINKLKSYMKDVYGTKINTQKEATFLLAAIQMVAEAARFPYIENKIPAGVDSVFNPDDKTICLESRWSKLSKAVRNAPAGQTINIKVDCPQKDYYLIIQGTTELKNHIALLSYNVGVANTLLESHDTDEAGTVPTLDGGSHAIL